MACDADGRPPLISAAEVCLARDSGVWARGVVRVGLRDRAVFDAVAPDGRAVVVKASWNQPALERERHVLEYAQAAGLPVPAVAQFLASSPSVLVLHRVSGRPLTTVRHSACWTEAGRLLRRLHGLPIEAGVPRFDPRDADWASFMVVWVQEAIERASGLGLISSAEAGALASGFAAHVSTMPSPPRVLLHGDCQPDHFLMLDDRVSGMVDFGDARVGDPSWDVAVLTAMQPDRLGTVLDGYDPHRELREHISRWVPAYRLLRQLGALCWRTENQLPHERELGHVKEQLARDRPWLS